MSTVSAYNKGYRAGVNCLSLIEIPLKPSEAKAFVQGYIDGTLNRVIQNSGDYLTF
jgi:hypothetical protein